MPEIPTELELAAGEERSFELPGLGTAGYVWDHEVVGEGDIVEVHWTRGVSSPSPPRPVGLSAPEVMTIRALRPGTVELRLCQHRRWEPPDLALAQRNLVVHVRAS
jgi:predicted secreted protein